MVANMGEQSAFIEEPVLESSYPTIPIPDLETMSACQYLLNSAKENVDLGRTRWLVRAIKLTHFYKSFVND